MHGKLSISVLLRAPVKTAITLVLLIATSFAFVSRGAEYATTVAEINKAEAQYSAVGTLQRSTEGYYAYMEDLLGEEVYDYENGAYIDRLSNATAPLEAEVVDLVLDSGYVAQDEFIMVAGGLTSEELRNITEQPLVDVGEYSDWEWFWTGGTFEMDSAFVEMIGGEIQDVLIGDEPEIYREKQRLALFSEDSLEASGTLAEVNDEVFAPLETGHRYLAAITTCFNGTRDTSKEFIPYVDYPVIDITRLEEEYGLTDYMEALDDPEKYGLVEYKNIHGFPTVSVLDYMETLCRNFHTQELVHVSDMNMLHKFHDEELYILEGRAITANDADVCVVSADYAALNNLQIGDTIAFELSADTMMHSGKVFGREPPYPSVSYAEKSLWDGNTRNAKVFTPVASEQSLTERGLDTVTQTYEIVGIWSDSNYDVADPFSYSPNTVFVPASTYPWQGEVEPTMLPSTLSFTLNHPGDMAKIEAELGDTLAAMGYELSINDMGYAEAAPSFEFMKLSALIGFVAMSAALLLSLVLITYLFIIRKKHDYAIMRALGTTRGRSNRSLLVGLFALAIPAVFLGSLLALALTQGFAADLSAQISEITGNATASSMPAWLVGAFGAGVLGLLLIFARFGLIKISRTPPLVLLQGTNK